MPKLTRDEKWRRFNEKLQELMKSNDFYGLGVVYQEMANFLDEEGKDSTGMRNKAYEMKLIHHQEYIKNLQNNSSVCSSVEVSCTEDSCKSCKDQNGKVFDFKTVLEKRPLPVRECQNIYGCRCTYLPVTD